MEVFQSMHYTGSFDSVQKSVLMGLSDDVIISIISIFARVDGVHFRPRVIYVVLGCCMHMFMSMYKIACGDLFTVTSTCLFGCYLETSQQSNSTVDCATRTNFSFSCIKLVRRMDPLMRHKRLADLVNISLNSSATRPRESLYSGMTTEYDIRDRETDYSSA